ncbi:NlpC/P60 family protein [Paenibacillus sedimenti]|uniref:NlpC/P60 family protein n=1 Tax=Paenibacillus sedimenti TaxID=2770274 RepID=UPI001CB6F896|nr:NlpC/P60 family protein [Paenibacillus sedimenti]
MEFDKQTENAIAWARNHMDSNDYRLRCLAFVEDAYERSNGIEMWGGSDANESAELYEVHANMGFPPKGAFVFYSCSGLVEGELKNWGHVGLSLGNGDAIHAWDKVRIDNYLEIESLAPAQGWTQPKFIGWAPVERILAGAHKKHWE